VHPNSGSFDFPEIPRPFGMVEEDLLIEFFKFGVHGGGSLALSLSADKPSPTGQARPDPICSKWMAPSCRSAPLSQDANGSGNAPSGVD
jgi:hypothetical protein